MLELYLVDYYGVISHHTPAIEGSNGFWVRRLRLAYSRDINDSFSGKIQLDTNNKGDFGDNGKIGEAVDITIKDAYLKWHLSEHNDVIFGLSSTPIWGIIEKFWGYRSVEKTVFDLQGVGSSRDMGIAFKGSYADGRYGYHLMFGNGESNSEEDDSNKSVYLSLFTKPIEGLIVEIYGEYEHEVGGKDKTSDIWKI